MYISCFTKERQLIRKLLDEFNEWDLIEVATILKPKENFINQLQKKDIKYEVINFDNVPCCVIHRDLYFYPKPKTATSPESEAIYPARSKNKMDGLLLQYLPLNSVTSKHYHQIRTEIYHNLEGCCFLEVDGRDILLEKNSCKVKPYTIHRVKTKNKPSLTLLEIIGDPKGLSMEDHFYVNL